MCNIYVAHGYDLGNVYDIYMCNIYIAGYVYNIYMYNIYIAHVSGLLQIKHHLL